MFGAHARPAAFLVWSWKPHKLCHQMTDAHRIYGRNILISDPEKTVTDCIDRPDLAGVPAELTRIVHAAMAKIDPDKLFLAAVQMKSTSLLQRLGFLTDLVGRLLPEVRPGTAKPSLTQ
jgi:predicted transcriptional regulator of viral defense system